MSQVDEQTNTQVIAADEGDLPAVRESDDQQSTGDALPTLSELDGAETSFSDKATQKVQLDLEDAPFLEDEPEKPAETATSKKEKTADGDEASQEPRSKKKLFIIAGAGLLLVIVAVVAFLFLLGPSEEDLVLQNFITIPKPAEEQIAVPIQTSLDPFWIDLKNDGRGAKFLVATFVLTLPDEHVKAELDGNKKKIRDAIYYYLTSVKPDFLMAAENITDLKKGIIDIVNPYLVTGSVDAVYFDSYLMK